MGQHTFTKQEKLTSETNIKELFKRGSSFNVYPFRVIYLSHPDQNWLFSQVLISVSSRNFKRAVDRNAIKRRMREAYRLNKSKLITPQKLLVGYIYISKEILPSSVIHEKMDKTLGMISAKELKREKNEGTSLG